MKSSRLLIMTLGLLMISARMFAHHNGGAIYDKSQQVSFTGTVTKYDFVNPHIRIHFDVKDDNGVVSNWVAESAPPQRVYRTGFNKDSLKLGDKIVVTGHPSKTGKKWLSVLKLVAPDGKTLSAGAD